MAHLLHLHSVMSCCIALSQAQAQRGIQLAWCSTWVMASLTLSFSIGKRLTRTRSCAHSGVTTLPEFFKAALSPAVTHLHSVHLLKRAGGICILWRLQGQLELLRLRIIHDPVVVALLIDSLQLAG